MKAKLNPLALSLLVLTFGPLLPSVATAQETTCPPNIASGVVTEKVIVPPGQTCSITVAQVRGNIEVGADARLTIDADEIRGNIELGADARLTIAGGTLHGNVACAAGGTVTLTGGVIVRGNISGCTVVVAA